MFVISTKDIDTRDYIHISMIFFEVQNVFDHHSIGFSLSSLCNTLSFLCDTMTFGSRENCREQFNIYHGGIIKVQSSKKRLVRFATVSIPPFSSKWRGTIEDTPRFRSISFDVSRFPPFFSPVNSYCLQCILFNILSVVHSC